MRPDPPLIAILRGITPAEAVAVGAALFAAGVRCVETPLNSPEALESISRLREAFDGRMSIGAGTVLSRTDLQAAAAAGAQFVVSPHVDAALIEAAKTSGLGVFAGFFTPTEALVAIEAGADGLKLFPADVASPAYVRALRAVLPSAPIYPTGGVSEALIGPYLDAGAAGFGIGTAFYRPGDSAAEVERKTAAFMGAYAAALRTR